MQSIELKALKYLFPFLNFLYVVVNGCHGDN